MTEDIHAAGSAEMSPAFKPTFEKLLRVIDVIVFGEVLSTGDRIVHSAEEYRGSSVPIEFDVQ